MAYDPLTGEGYTRAEAVTAWSGSMERARREKADPHRWVLHGEPGSWHWRFFNFRPYTGSVTIEGDGFHWQTRSYDQPGNVLHEGVTTSLYEAYQSVEQNKVVLRQGEDHG